MKPKYKLGQLVEVKRQVGSYHPILTSMFYKINSITITSNLDPNQDKIYYYDSVGNNFFEDDVIRIVEDI